MKISVVTTLYNSERFIQEFARRIEDSVNELGCDYELVLVNDGSPDNSLNVALDVCRTNPRVRVVDLARNFGHHPAIMVGLREAEGDYVFLIDVDLEEAPPLGVAGVDPERKLHPLADLLAGEERVVDLDRAEHPPEPVRLQGRHRQPEGRGDRHDRRARVGADGC